MVAYNPVPLLMNNNKFSTYYFYTEFLSLIALFYRTEELKDQKIEFILSSDIGDEKIFFNNRIDPIALPLLATLGEQLKQYYGRPVEFSLINTPSTNKLLAFLERSDFFKIIGDYSEINPLGENIYDINTAYLGDFNKISQRPEHKIRKYSLNENNSSKLSKYDSDEHKRDFLVDHYTYQVADHFASLLFSSTETRYKSNLYVEILSELITNGVFHSNSNVYALMYSDRFVTKLAISDNGIGFYESLKRKKDSYYYKKFEVYEQLFKQYEYPVEITSDIKSSLFSILEALYYSLLKDRYGLFDLILNVIDESKGIVRIHNRNAQIIISSRLNNQLNQLRHIRDKIIDVQMKRLYDKNYKVESDYKDKITELSAECRIEFLQFANKLLKGYSKDIIFSSIRLYEVSFKGVHIEVEISNQN